MSEGSPVRVSILSAVFNETRHIDEMIASVVSQTESSWELLFVDDDSTDDTVQRISQWSAEDPRIRVIGAGRKLGKVAAFNLAFEHSTGDVIVLLAGDDRLTPASLEVRHAALRSALLTNEKRAGAFRLVTISEDRRFDGQIIPRRREGNLSGGTIALTRPLAEVVFPIPTELVAEDIWIAEVVRAIAPDVVTSPEIVLEYRIHSGNSNPRALAFPDMNESMHRRALPYRLLLDHPRFQLQEADRRRLQSKADVERFRHAGDLLRLLAVDGVPWVDKLRALSMSSRATWALRRRFFRLFSGRGGS